MLPDILVPLMAIGVGGLVVLIPLTGLTARFALKPLVESWSHLRANPASDSQLGMLERRISLLEQQIDGLERQNERLIEESDFRRELKSVNS